MELAAVPDPDPAQTSIDEKVIDDAELAKLLDDREKANGAKREATKKFKTLDEMAKHKLEEHGELEGGDRLRVGRHVVKVSERESAHVEFERQPGKTIRIAVAKD